MKYKVGDKVRIKESSKYYIKQGYLGIGTVIKDEEDNSYLPYLIEYDRDFMTGWYGEEDLEYVVDVAPEKSYESTLQIKGNKLII